MAKLSDQTKSAIKEKTVSLKVQLAEANVVLSQKQREFDDAKARLDKIKDAINGINAAIAALDKDFNEDGKV